MNNALALSYINEIGVLFEENNGDLTANPTTAGLSKTFTIIRIQHKLDVPFISLIEKAISFFR
jgi:hypothetical protein